jgi:putative FmdB family regulatory protein
MPIYEYQREDGSVFEITQSIKDEALSVCPTTGQKVRKIISRSAFKLEGGGWYKDGYGSKPSVGTGSSSTGSSDTGSSESSASKTESPAKPAGKSCGSGCGCH